VLPRSDNMFIDADGEPVGRVLSVKGSQATIALPEGNLGHDSAGAATVGKFLAISTPGALLVGLIATIRREAPTLAQAFGHFAVCEMDLMGEIREFNGAPSFKRGVTQYPAIGDAVRMVSGDQLRIIYASDGPNMVRIGLLQQDSSIPACINIQDMISKHFAIVGTTGVGKSTSVALILDQILQARPDLRIFLLDTHNEYSSCFKGRSITLNPRNLKLPFWLFNFEEIIDVFYGGRPGNDEEIDVLGETIPQAKAAYAQQKPGVRRVDAKNSGFTVDTPVPYRLADLTGMIDEQMGRLENRSSRMKFNRLLSRIETVRNDPRYMFMFENANVGGDTMAETIQQMFRLPADGMPMTIMQLAGFPSEVVDAVVSVLGRMAFDFGLWSDGAAPMLFMCEEAHRYASADRTTGFGPTRKALSRIAKEGRKYGVFLGLITQRPAELDPTILSQCSTLFAMRLSNERDQAFLRAAVADAGANLLDYVPSLGTAEVLAFGEGVALPTRLKFDLLPAHKRPSSESVGKSKINSDGTLSSELLNTVIERWRGSSTATQKTRMDDGDLDLEEAVKHEFGSMLTTAPTQTLPGWTAGESLIRKTSQSNPPVSIRKQPVTNPEPEPSNPSRSPSTGARAAFGRFMPPTRR
jgi:DNA helicase HerA-like ATPase